MSSISIDYFECINSDDLKDIFQLAGEELNEQEIRSLQNPILAIENLCNVYLTSLDKIIYNKNDAVRKTSKNENNYAQIQLFGAKILYSIRSFLMEEDIYFLLGDIGPNGQFVEKEVPQSTALKQLQANLRQGSVILNHQLDAMSNMQITQTSIGSL